MKISIKKRSVQNWALCLYFTATALEGIAVLLWVLLIPADPKHSLFLGYSQQRLVMLAVCSLITGLHVFFAWKFWRQPEISDRSLRPVFTKGMVWLPVTILAAISMVIGWLSLVALNERIPIEWYDYYTRLLPFLVWLSVWGFLTLILFPVARFGIHWENLRKQRSAWLGLVISLGVFLTLWGFIGITRVGIDPDALFWDDPGAPVLLIQVLEALGIGVLIFAGELFVKSRIAQSAALQKLKRYAWILDVLGCVLIWYWASQTWLSEPIARSYFAPAARPPNNEVYPYSDAADYNRNANMLLIGEGFGGKIITPKPLYVLFLAFLHVLAGPSYADTIDLQVVFLALFPVGLYLLGRALHCRGAGVMAAMIAIARERNAIALTLFMRISNSKLYMSDFPTALAIVIFTLLVIRWLKDPENRRWMAIVIGGALGLLLLLRPQTALLLPFVLLALALVLGRNWRKILEGTLLVVAGVVLSVTPWLTRNWIVTGEFSLVASANIAGLNERFTMPPGENTGAADQNINSGSDDSRGEGNTLSVLLADPAETVRFTSAHFFHNVIESLQVLPLTFNIDYFEELPLYIKTRAPFWHAWDGSLIPQQKVLLFVNLAVVAAGIGIAWYLWRWVGLVPLLLYIGYMLSNALARNSGWRYILPVDWVVYFYIGVGSFQIIKWSLELLGEKSQPGPVAALRDVAHGSLISRPLIFGALAVLVAGLSFPVLELIIPHRYPALNNAQIVEQALDKGAFTATEFGPDDLNVFLENDKAVALIGRALYPRFFLPYQGEPGEEGAFTAREYSRLGFRLAGPRRAEVILPVQHPPVPFPDSSDVLVIGCDEEDVIDAAVVVILSEPVYVHYRAPLDQLTCPLGNNYDNRDR